jgi:hypothetical protein
MLIILQRIPSSNQFDSVYRQCGQKGKLYLTKQERQLSNKGLNTCTQLIVLALFIGVEGILKNY